jgi:dihydroorotase
MLACGMSLEEVVRSTTVTPAAVIGQTDFGSLETGAPARFTIFDVESGTYEFLDTGAPDDATSGSDPGCQQRFSGQTLLRPRWCVIGSAVTECAELEGVDAA